MIVRLFLCALLGFPALAGAHEYKVGDLTLQHPWARATPPAAPVAAGYLTIVNEGTATDRLVSVGSALAERIEVHDITMEDGIARMRRVDDLSIGPGESVALRPGAKHLMISKPFTPLVQGQRFPATLVFERAGAVSVELAIQPVGAGEGTHDDHRATTP